MSSLNQNMLFSIIIPTYNRANMIVIAIESILKQSFQYWELIIVDDGSTDDTAAVVKSYTRKDSRIKYFFQNNQGVSNARNLGIKLAGGDFICFLDDDDYYYSNFLEEFEKIIQQSLGIPMVYMCGQAEETEYGVLNRKFDQNLFNRNVIGYLISYGNNIQPFVFPKTIFSEILFDSKYKYGEDFHFLMRVLLKFPVFYISQTLCIYKNHIQMTFSRELKQGMFSGSENNKLNMLDDLFIKYGDDFRKKKVYSKLCYKYNKYCYFYAGAALRNEKPVVSLSLLKRMKWRYPNLILIYYYISVLGRLPYYVIKTR